MGTREADGDPLVAVYPVALPQVYGYLLPRCGSAALLRRLRGEAAARDSASVRYFVSDLDRAVAFYRDQLGFEEELRPGGGFAMLYRADLRLLLSTPGGTHRLPDGTLPEPGGWNRIALRVADLEATVEAPRAAGRALPHRHRREPGRPQRADRGPSGNPVELFEPLAGYQERRS